MRHLPATTLDHLLEIGLSLPPRLSSGPQDLSSVER